MPGPGKISMKRLGSQEMMALLYNFEIRSSQLKPEHSAWIHSTLFPWASIQDMGLMIVGLTSRTGKDHYNMTLSKARAEAVSSQLFQSTHKMAEETMVYVGEKAAALVGIQEGVEDERWRAVWVHVGNNKSPVVLPTTRFVPRRSHVTILLKEEMKTFSGGEPGEKAYQAAQAFRRTRGMTDGILTEQTQMVDETFGLKRITIERTNRSEGVPIVAEYSMEFLKVRYEWGSWDGSSRHVTFIYKKHIQARGAPKDVVTSINPVVAEDWLNRPLWAHENL